MSTQKHYPTDVTDRQWQLIGPLLPPHPKQWEAGWGCPPCDRRSMFNGILSVNKTGCPWRMLPKDDGHWNTVFSYFNRWRKQGGWARVMATRCAWERQRQRRLSAPPACRQAGRRAVPTPIEGWQIRAGVPAGQDSRQRHRKRV